MALPKLGEEVALPAPRGSGPGGPGPALPPIGSEAAPPAGGAPVGDGMDLGVTEPLPRGPVQARLDFVRAPAGEPEGVGGGTTQARFDSTQPAPSAAVSGPSPAGPSADDLHATYAAVRHVNPDQQAEVARVSRETGVPPDVVSLDPKAIAAAQPPRELAMLPSHAPALARHLAEPSAMAGAHDDLGAMMKLEGALTHQTPADGGFWSLTGAAIRKGLAGLDLSLQQFGEQFGVPLQEETVAALAAAVADGHSPFSAEGIASARRDLRVHLESSAAVHAATAEAAARDLGAQNIFARAWAGAMTAAPSLAWYGLGGFSAALATTAGPLAERLGEVKKKGGAPLSSTEKLGTALAIAAPVAGLQMFGGQFATGLATKAADKVVADVIKRALVENTIPKMLGRLALRTTGETALGAGVMAASTAMEGLGFQLARKGFDPSTSLELGEVGQETLQTLQSAAVDFSLLSLFGAGRHLLHEAGVSHLSSQQAKALRDAAAALSDSKVAGRDPAQVEQVVGQIAPGQSALVDRAGWDAYWRGKGKDKSPAKEAADIAGDNGESYRAAAESGGLIAFPLNRFLSSYAKTEHLVGLANDTKLTPEARTPREEAAFQVQQMKMAEEARTARGASFDKEKEILRAQIEAEAEKVDLPDDVRASVPHVASYISEAAGTLALRLGTSVSEAGQRMGLARFRHLGGQKGEQIGAAVVNQIRAQLSPQARLDEELADRGDRRAQERRDARTWLDPLTQLYGRNGFVDYRENSDAGGWQVSVDVNDLKAQDIAGGHDVGNAALLAAAQAMRSANERMGGDLQLFRQGGDELFAGRAKTKEQAQEFAKALDEEMRRAKEVAPGWKVGVSVGIGPGFHEADAAMYRAKAAKAEKLGTYRGGAPLEKFGVGENFIATHGEPMEGEAQAPRVVEQPKNEIPIATVGDKPVTLTLAHPLPERNAGRVVTQERPGTGEPIHYRVIEAADLVPSHDPGTFSPNPEYPEGVQERDYRREASEQLKVQKGVAAFNPAFLLSDTPSALDGPPIVTSGEKALVLGGNGRSMMLKLALANEESAKRYRTELEAKAQALGVDPETFKDMTAPVLVREVDGLGSGAPKADLVKAVRRFNTGMTQELSPKARAIAEAKTLRPETVSAIGEILSRDDRSLAELLRDSPGDIVSVLRRDSVITEQNQPQWLQGGHFTAEGRDRIQGLFLGRAIGTLERMDQTTPGVLAKVEKIAPALLQVEGLLPDVGETPTVQKALDLLNEARIRKMTIDQIVSQIPLFGAERPEPVSVAMARLLGERNTQEVREAFGRWRDWATRGAQVDPRQAMLFGEAPAVPTQAEGRAVLLGREATLQQASSILEQPAFHGTPYRGIGAFSTDKIGTGQGAQSYGWGLYFAENRDVAESYRLELSPGPLEALADGWGAYLEPARDSLAARLASEFGNSGSKWTNEDDVTIEDRARELGAERTELSPGMAAYDFGDGSALVVTEGGWDVARHDKHAGQLYKVELPEKGTLLDWDRLISEQPSAVLEDLKKSGMLIASEKHPGKWLIPVGKNEARELDTMTGETLYRSLADTYAALGHPRPDQGASEDLRDAGVPGLMYADQGSRGRRGDVLFDGKAIDPESFKRLSQVEQEALDAIDNAQHFQPQIESLHALLARAERWGGDNTPQAFRDAVQAIGKRITIEEAPRTHNFVMWDEKAIEIRDHLYQAARREGDAPRGMVRMRLDATGRPVDFPVQIFAGDASTLAHETGHFLSWAMHDVATSEQGTALAPDYGALIKWAGYESPEERLQSNLERGELEARADALTAAEQGRLKELRAREERIGHGFEQYLAEGKTPSTALARAFAWMRSNLLKVYQGIFPIAQQYRQHYGQELGLSDEVRGIFDRWLAAERDVDQVEAQGVSEKDAAFLAGLEPADRASILRARATRRAEAEQGVYVALQQAEQVEHKDVREQVREQIRKEMAETPIGRLRDYLGRSRNPEAGVVDAALGLLPAELLDGNGRPWRLDRGELVAQYGEGILKELPRGATAKDGGAPADWMAERFGFEDGADMVKALRSAGDQDAVLEAKTTDRMKELFPSAASNPAAAVQQAVEAEHSPRAAEEALIGARILARRVDPSLALRLRVMEDAKGRNAQADRLIKGMAVADISQNRFLQAERKWAKEAVDLTGRAMKAAGQKRTELAAQAMDARDAQLLNGALWRKARDAGIRAEATRDYLRDMQRDKARRELGKATSYEPGPDGTPVLSQPYLDRMDDLTAKIDFRKSGTPQLDKDGNRVSRAQRFQEWLGSRPQDEQDDIMSRVRDPDLIRGLDQPVHWKTLTVQQLEDLRSAAEGIEAQAKLKKKLRFGGEDIDKEQGIAQLISEVQERKPGGALTLVPRAEPLGETKSGLRRARYFVERAEETLRQLGPTATKLLFQPVSDGDVRYRQLFREVTQPIMDAIEALPHADKAALRDSFKVDGQTLDGEAALAMLLNWGNASNRYKLLRGFEIMKQKNLPGLKLGPESVAKIIEGRFTRAQAEVVQKIWDQLSSKWEQIADLEREHTGLAPPKIEAQPFKLRLADGSEFDFQGGYYPVVYDHRLSNAGQRMGEQMERGGVNAMAFLGERAVTPQGHLQQRFEQFARPIDLSLNAVPRHLTESMKDLAMRDPLISARDVLTDGRVRDAISDAIGPEGYKSLVDWWRRQANDSAMMAGGLGRFFMRTRSRTMGATLAWNLPVALQHVTNWISSMTLEAADESGKVQARVPAKFMARATLRFGAERGDLVSTVTERSPYMFERFKDAEAASIQRAVSDVTLRRGKLTRASDEIRERGMWFIHAITQTTATVAHEAAFQHAVAAQAEGGLGMEHDAAIQHADQIVRLTQGSYRALDRSAIEMSPAWKPFTMFSGYLNSQLQQFIGTNADAARLFRAGAAGQAAKLIAYNYGLLVTSGLLAGVLVGKAPKPNKDTGEVEGKDWAEFLATEALLYPLSTAPLMRSSIEQILGEKSRDQSLVPWSHVLMAAGKAVHQTEKAFSDDAQGGELTEAGLQVLQLWGWYHGLPVTQLRRTGNFWVDHTPDGFQLSDESQEAGLGGKVGGTVYGRKRPGSLMQVIQGD